MEKTFEFKYEIHEGNFNLYSRDEVIGTGYSNYYEEPGKRVLKFLSQVPNQGIKTSDLEKSLFSAFDKAFDLAGGIIPIKEFEFTASDLNSDEILTGTYPPTNKKNLEVRQSI